MEKDFQKWHNKKSHIDGIKKRPFFHEREIWHCHLGVNVGFEQDGKGENYLRPVIIFRKFNDKVFWAIPLTKSDKKINEKAEKYYFHFSFSADIKSIAILSQIRLVDARRLNNKIGEISKPGYKALIEKLMVLFP